MPSSWMDGGRGFLLWTVIYASIPLVAILVLLFGPLVLDGMGREPFDAARWRAAEGYPAKQELRMNMVYSLLSRHELVGKTKAEIEALLGPEDALTIDLWTVSYELADKPGLFAEGGRRLTIYLDDADVAYSYKLRD